MDKNMDKNNDTNKIGSIVNFNTIALHKVQWSESMPALSAAYSGHGQPHRHQLLLLGYSATKRMQNQHPALS